jgi:hypothetical protein
LFGKYLAVAAAVLGTQVSCAKPNYASAPISTQEKAANDCAYHFASGLCVSYAWEQMPTGSSFGSFVFKTFRADAKSSTVTAENIPLTAAVVLWMPDMPNMGSSPVSVQQIDTGVYRASNVFFSMRGKWEIKFQSKDGDEVRDQAAIPLTL